MPNSDDAFLRDRDKALSLIDVSRETVERLDRLAELMLRWQRIKNLVARDALSQLWTRHILDSLQLVSLAERPRLWLDLGSGGGFPGLVAAAALSARGGGSPAGSDSGCEVHLVESNARKCAFLREAARVMNVSATVHAARIEDVVDDFAGRADIVSARALAALPQLVAWSEKLLTTGAIALFPKGKDATHELTETAKCWRLDYTIHNSLTDPAGRILRITKAERRGP